MPTFLLSICFQIKNCPNWKKLGKGNKYLALVLRTRKGREGAEDGTECVGAFPPRQGDCPINPGKRGKVIRRLRVSVVGLVACPAHLLPSHLGGKKEAWALVTPPPPTPQRSLGACKLPRPPVFPEKRPESTGQQEQLWSGSHFTLTSKHSRKCRDAQLAPPLAVLLQPSCLHDAPSLPQY